MVTPAMRLLDSMLRRFVRVGTLTVTGPRGARRVYAGAEGPAVAIRLTEPRLARTLFLNPELRAGEAYMDGTLLIEDGTLRDLLLLFARNRANLRTQPIQRTLRRALKSLRRLHQHNPVRRARANAAHHYDLSNAFYRLFLDDELNYSCAYFRAPGESLEEAQQNKLRHVAAKLALAPGQRVLDIGCGWGAMAFHLAEQADVEVLGVSLSEAQIGLARERARERGLDGRVRFALADYRSVTGPFDRVVSIGMFEHVGIGHYTAFFDTVAGLLSDDGVALLHSIGRKGGPGTTGAWVRKYIFPGGYSPALSEVLPAVERSGLWVTDIEILRMHYAETLAAWEQRFQARRGEAAALFDERFCRMWEFYLIASELTFRYGNHMVFQMQLAKRVDALPYTRDYLGAAEAAPPRTALAG